MAGRGQLERAGRPRGGRGQEEDDGSGGQAEQALGRSRGDFGSRIRSALTPTGQPAALELTGSQADDSPHLPGPISGTDYVIADKSYGSADDRAAIAAAGAGASIPPRRNRRERTRCDRHPYKERHVVECRSVRLEQHRRIATCHDRKAVNFLGFVRLASINIVFA